MTVNVFTETLVKDAGIYRPADFIQMVPNMTLVETQNAGNAFVVVRGISQARNSEPSVAVQVDGVLRDQPRGVQPGAVRHPADRGAEGTAGRALRAQRDWRRHHHHDCAARRRVRGDGQGRLRQRELDARPARRQRARSATTPATARPSTTTRPTASSTTCSSTRRPIPSRTFRLACASCSNRATTSAADVRVSMEDLSTKALYFVIPRDDEANPFSLVLDGAGRERRDLADPARQPGRERTRPAECLAQARLRHRRRHAHVGDPLQLDRGNPHRRRVRLPAGRELDLHGAVRLRPSTQSQFLDVESYSQELRYTSPTEGKFRWIAGAYYVHTDRFISTGNVRR